MVIITCPNCNRTISVAEHSGDFVHDCDSGNDSLDFEDVPLVGKWEDYSGSGGQAVVSKQGAENKIFGTKAEQLGAPSVHEVTNRGNRKSTTRTRRKLTYMIIDNVDLINNRRGGRKYDR